MAEKQHICARMVEVIEASSLSVAQFEAKAKMGGIKVSGGYLRKAAKNSVNIGIDLVDYFLDEFPEISAEWLLKGTGNRATGAQKHTAATKSNEAAVIDVLERTVSTLREENMKLLNIVELSFKRGGPDRT